MPGGYTKKSSASQKRLLPQGVRAVRYATQKKVQAFANAAQLFSKKSC